MALKPAVGVGLVNRSPRPSIRYNRIVIYIAKINKSHVFLIMLIYVKQAKSLKNDYRLVVPKVQYYQNDIAKNQQQLVY